jgi:biopolymer transport protein ExbB
MRHTTTCARGYTALVVLGAIGVAATPMGALAQGAATSMAEAFFIQRHPTTHKLELLGSVIIWVLVALSAACLGLLGARAMENRRARIVPEGLADRVGGLAAQGRIDDAVAVAKQDPSDLASMLIAALGEARSGAGAALRGAEQSAEELLLRRLRRIEPLNIVGNVAPMIGLFGTVYGMIVAFREIVRAGGTPDPVSLAAGIGTALVTTFWGLIVAIPALAGYALLRNAIEGHALGALRQAEQVVDRLGTGQKGAAP